MWPWKTERYYDKFRVNLVSTLDASNVRRCFRDPHSVPSHGFIACSLQAHRSSIKVTMSAPPTITPVAISIAPLQCTFHPSLTIHITIPPSSRPESGSLCRAVLRLDLPDAAFVDPDELEGRWGARTLISTNVVEASGGGSGNVGRGIRWDAWPEMIDIERAVRDRRTRRSAPASPSHAWSSSEKPGGDDELEEREGSSLWLSVPIDAHDEGVDELECESMSVDVDVPLHGRYLRPDDSGLVDINLFDASGEEHAGHRHIRAGMICEPPGRDAWLRQGQSRSSRISLVGPLSIRRHTDV
jgi:hypothetical protein